MNGFNTQAPIELINVVPFNPLISKCQIKVCWVGYQPNRNKSVITKDVAREMANSLPGSPIVGHFNEATGDFEEHNKLIQISGGKIQLKPDTVPYGFVDLNAKVWFQKFLDDGVNEREYLMTEGYIWTGQYPEAQRIIDKGNNQSMELSENYLDATWTKDDNGKPQFFIINEAIVSKLCILGDDCEPCFEGSQITKLEFSFDDSFKTQLFSMMNELKEYLKEGGAKEVFTRYAVEIGDTLWSALYSHIEKAYPDVQNCYCSVYRIEGIFEDNGQKFAVLQSRSDMKYYRLNFALTEEAGFVPSETLIEVTKSYTPAEEPQFALEAVEEFEAEYLVDVPRGPVAVGVYCGALGCVDDEGNLEIDYGNECPFVYMHSSLVLAEGEAVAENVPPTGVMIDLPLGIQLRMNHADFKCIAEYIKGMR